MAHRLTQKQMDIAIERAYLATNAYTKYADQVKPPPPWECVATTADLINTDHTSFAGAVYRNGAKFVIAFCGFSDAGDILPVLSAGFTGLPSQLADAIEFTQKACAKFDITSNDLELTGHSLGGYLATSVGLHMGAQKVWTFNNPGFKKEDAGHLSDFFAKLNIAAPAKHPHVITLNSKYDLIGKWGYQKGRVIEIDTPHNHHNMMVMIETLSQMCFLRNQPEHASPLRLAARKFFDSIGEAEGVRDRLDTMFHRAHQPKPVHKHV